MSKITLDNLSDNLKAYLEGLGLSEEQVLNLINENGLDEEELKAMLKDTMSISELNTNSKTVIGAINELFQSANNGKELIASAIGEPLSSNDTFSAMSDGINNLNSQFKSALMNNGVSIESDDKFKQMIDKLAALAEEGSGKGIQYASGYFTGVLQNYDTGDCITFNIDCDFVPTVLFLRIAYVSGDGYSEIQNIFVSNLSRFTINPDPRISDGYTSTYLIEAEITNLTNSSFDIHIINGSVGKTVVQFTEYYAIGVGENNTSGLNIISATELPAKGVDNQICVITDKPVDLFTVSSNFNDKNNTDTSYITLYLGNTATNDASEGTLLSVSGGNVITNYYFVKACQGEKRLASYYWSNNQWKKLTQSGIYFVENGVERNRDYFGGIPNGSAVKFNSNGLTLLYSYSSPYKQVTTKNTINFSLYDKLDITIRNPDTSNSYYVCIGFASTDHFTSYGWYPTNSSDGNKPGYNNVTDAYQEIQATRGQTVSKTIDISSWTGEGWLFLATYNGNMDLYITDLKLY